MKRLDVWIDGCCEPRNPGGTAAYGVVVKEDGKTIHQEGKIVGSGAGISNNVGEYSGLLAYLNWLIKSYPADDVYSLVHSDSKLLICQMAGEWRVKAGLYVPYYKKARKLIENNQLHIGFVWVPREQNQEADDLSKAPLKAAGIKFRIQPEG